MNSLHEDLLAAVLSHLDVAERARASRTCRRWRTAALQPPHSTKLTLNVLLLLDSEPEQRPLDDSRVALSEDAVALLRGPLCEGLQALRLGLALPGEADSVPGACAAAFGAVLAALPPSLLSLSVAALDPPAYWRSLALDKLGYQPVVEMLHGLRHATPNLEELALDLHCTLDLASLELSHPSLRRLGAQFVVLPHKDLDVSLLPRLEVVHTIVAGPASASLVASLVRAGIRAERLDVACALDREHLRLLRPGAALLRLVQCTLPDGEDWILPAGLAQLRLEYCILTPASLRFLLHRTGTYAPGLRRLVVEWNLEQADGECTPDDVIAALEGVPGGTQIEVEWPRDWHRPWSIGLLAETLAGSPTLQRYVHVATDPLTDSVHAETANFVRGALAPYRRARAAALRAMGEDGLLVEQGYDND